MRICNSVVATLIVSFGMFIVDAQKVPALDITDDHAVYVGGTPVVLGVILGIIKPPFEALVWRIAGYKHPSFKCIECGAKMEKDN